ncbi:MAG: ROK family protein [Phycisphaerales bacterium]|nr:ROK family protein [Phycisphaerales bacterium]
MTEQMTIGIDVGGTNMRAALLDERAAVRQRVSTETLAAEGFDAVMQRCAGLVTALLTNANATNADWPIGIGVPGPLSHKTGVVLNAPNLPGWKNAPVRDRLAALTERIVVVENDANAAAYGEFVAGAGEKSGDMVMLTLGTGIGGGVILNGELIRGHFDNAGEIGHMVVEPAGRECPCGQRGCLERYASAAAIADRVREALAGGEQSSLSNATELDSGAVQAAAAAGDALASRIWSDACRYLAIACVNLQHILNPRTVVLAGGLINAGEALLDGVAKEFRRLTWKMADDAPAIRLAQLAGDAGVIGAALLARKFAGGTPVQSAQDFPSL